MWHGITKKRRKDLRLQTKSGQRMRRISRRVACSCPTFSSPHWALHLHLDHLDHRHQSSGSIMLSKSSNTRVVTDPSTAICHAWRGMQAPQPFVRPDVECRLSPPRDRYFMLRGRDMVLHRTTGSRPFGRGSLGKLRLQCHCSHWHGISCCNASWLYSRARALGAGDGEQSRIWRLGFPGYFCSLLGTGPRMAAAASRHRLGSFKQWCGSRQARDHTEPPAAAFPDCKGYMLRHLGGWFQPGRRSVDGTIPFVDPKAEFGAGADIFVRASRWWLLRVLGVSWLSTFQLSRFRVSGFGFWPVLKLSLRSRFRVSGFGFRVSGFGFGSVLGLR